MAAPALYLELRAGRKTTRVARRNDMNNRPYTGLSNITPANLIRSKEKVVSHVHVITAKAEWRNRSTYSYPHL